MLSVYTIPLLRIFTALFIAIKDSHSSFNIILNMRSYLSSLLLVRE